MAGERAESHAAQAWLLTEVGLVGAAFQPYSFGGALDQEVPDELIGQVSTWGQKSGEKKDKMKTAQGWEERERGREEPCSQEWRLPRR